MTPDERGLLRVAQLAAEVSRMASIFFTGQLARTQEPNPSEPENRVVDDFQSLPLSLVELI